MDPVTHALTSLALARAGQRQIPPFGAVLILTGGLAPDLDYASYFAGPGPFLRLHRSVLHSVPGAIVVATVCALVFWAIDRARAPRDAAAKSPHHRLRLGPAVLLGAIGTVAHIVLDLASGTGVQLFWPFYEHRYAWNLIANLDPWVLILLATGLLVPQLLRMVGEEIGERRKHPRGSLAAICVLVLFAAYLGGRGALHNRAVDLLLSRDYRSQAPLSAGAFPLPTSPFDWRGVVVTDNTLEEASVPLAPGKEFDADRSVTHYKPEDSPALDAGQRSDATQLFLKYARFPIATVARLEDGYRFELHDVQFAPDDMSPENIFVRVDFDSSLHILRQRFFFASAPNP